MTGKTPLYAIPYPDGTTKASKLGDELAAMGLGVEAALVAASIPDATNPDRAVALTDIARDAHFGKPASEADRLALQRRGAECIRPDKGWTERYYATYDAGTNPQGTAAPGWWPVAGRLPFAVLIPTQAQQSMPAGQVTKVTTWQADRTWQFGTLTGGSDLTVTVPGLYLISAMVNGSSGSQVFVNVNGVTVSWSGTGDHVVNTTELALKAGDVISVSLFTTATQNVPTNRGRGRLSASYLGPL